MNRQAILESIQLVLQESLAETGTVRPLGEIVPLVAARIRTEQIDASQGVVPIGLVAGFVDGTINEASAKQVCQAAMHDNSVLAEIIAALRAQRELADATATEPLAQDLHLRLSKMFEQNSQPMASRPVANPPAAELVKAIPVASSSSASPGESSTAVAGSPADLAQDSDAKPTTRSAVRTGNSKRIWVAALIAVAATILVAYVGNRLAGPRRNVVVQPNVPPIPNANTPDSNSIVIESENAPPNLPVEAPEVMAQNNPPLDSSDTAGTRDSVATLSPPENALANDPTAALGNDGSPNSMDMLPSVPEADLLAGDTEPSLWEGFQWKQIDGLLVRRDSDDANQIDASSASYREVWNRIAVAEPVIDRESPRERVSVRTLPMSRAQAELPEGGRIVIAPDTNVTMAAVPADRLATRIDLQHGSIALMDLPEGTRLMLTGNGKRLGNLSWNGKASVVLEFVPEGLAVQVYDGSIAANDGEPSEQPFVLQQDGVMELRKLPTLPRWINSRKDTLPRNILAQFENTLDLSAEISRRLNAIDENQVALRDRPTLIALTQLQAAMAGNRLLRLTSSPKASVRLAAWSRLVSIPEWDPRYAQAWRPAAADIRDARRLMRLQELTLQLGIGRSFERSQVEQLLTSLESTDAPNRFIADQLLRRSYNGSAPPFDPNWALNNRIRAINAWRKSLGFPAINAARGAANQNRP